MWWMWECWECTTVQLFAHPAAPFFFVLEIMYGVLRASVEQIFILDLPALKLLELYIPHATDGWLYVLLHVQQHCCWLAILHVEHSQQQQQYSNSRHSPKNSEVDFSWRNKWLSTPSFLFVFLFTFFRMSWTIWRAVTCTCMCWVHWPNGCIIWIWSCGTNTQYHTEIPRPNIVLLHLPGADPLSVVLTVCPVLCCCVYCSLLYIFSATNII